MGGDTASKHFESLKDSSHLEFSDEDVSKFCSNNIYKCSPLQLNRQLVMKVLIRKSLSTGVA